MKAEALALLAFVFGISVCAYASESTGQSRTTPVTGEPTTPVTGNRLVAQVLVVLKGDYKPEGELDAIATKAQRTAIAAAQARVISAIKAETGIKPNAKAAARVKRRYVTVPGLALELKPDVVRSLEQLPDVAKVYEDRLNRPNLASSTDVVGSRQANMFGVDGKGQVVAILDSGVHRNHPFLGTGRFVANACFSTSSWFSNDQRTLCPNGEEQQFGGSSGADCEGIPECDHGTHVAGIVGGFLDQNGSGSVDLDERKGVAPRVKFIAMQIFSRHNNNDVCSAMNP